MILDPYFLSHHIFFRDSFSFVPRLFNPFNCCFPALIFHLQSSYFFLTLTHPYSLFLYYRILLFLYIFLILLFLPIILRLNLNTLFTQSVLINLCSHTPNAKFSFPSSLFLLFSTTTILSFSFLYHTCILPQERDEDCVHVRR